MTTDTVIADLRKFIVDQFLDGKDAGFDAQTPVLEWGIIESMSLVSVLAHVRERFGVEIPHEELTAENLRNLQAIAELVVRSSGSRG